MTFQKSGVFRQKQIRCMVTKAPLLATGTSFVIHPYNLYHRACQLSRSRSVMALNRYWWFGGGQISHQHLLRKMQFISIRCIKFATSTIPPITHAVVWRVLLRITSRWKPRYRWNFLRSSKRSHSRRTLSFVTDCTEAFVSAYMPIVERRDMDFQRRTSTGSVSFVGATWVHLTWPWCRSASGMVNQQSVFNCMLLQPPGHMTINLPE